MPLISIITINLNNKSGLKGTIESVLLQSFKHFEFILIDGNSIDGSLDLIKHYALNFSYWISEPDKGIYNAMNKGIEVARGEYLLFLNSGDTLVNSDVLEEVKSNFKGEDLVYGNLKVISADTTWIKTYPSNLSFKYFLFDTLPHPATFIKRSLFYQIGLYNESNQVVSDWEFFMLAVNRFNCSYKHIPLTISNFSNNGMSSQKEFFNIQRGEIARTLVNHFPTLLPDYEELERLEGEMQSLQKKYNLLLNSRFYRLHRKIRDLFGK